ncbi:hypothetical protein [Nostoc sp. CHAB 5715]|uniref:hypothetical protein n=1 Tax=Nostoc sp. CHAB 5715 TaxID=2780400 RepID=UPI001E3E2A5B|nr:hypothetical protein [Nostoc sp. CHAB 5715]MCC5620674.1 hypothetical protein [Nostoc sp. CHAB 5715]
MNMKFIHFQHPNSDTFLCFDKIAYVQRIEDVIFIHFDGDSKPVQLRKREAEVFLRVVQDNSLTIYRPSPEEVEEVGQ